MSTASSSTHPIGWPAAPFELPDPGGRRYTLDAVRGKNGLVVMFICNHCPYVKAVGDRIARDARELAAHGIGSIAITSNDPAEYPEDAVEHMAPFAARYGFTFPYVVDATQAVARAYGAACTPDFFGFDRGLKLAYRGRLDDSGRTPHPDAKRELFDAMVEVAKTGKASAAQVPSIGCSIKWK